MKKTIFFAICSLFISILSFGQTSTEQFETESPNSTSFTDNGVIFNIISHQATFDIYNLSSGGWSGTAADNRFIDNTGTATLANTNPSFSIKTTSNLFKVNKFWVYVANYLFNQNSTGTLTVAGKLSGVTKFSQTKETGFTNTTSVTNGYTLIDLTNLNGMNYSNIIIDEIRITLGGDYRYMALDAFTWVKDSGVVLASNEVKSSKKDVNIYPNPTKGSLNIKTSENMKLDIYSQSGQLVKIIEVQKGNNEINISELQKGVYIVKSASESYKIIKE